MRLCFCSVKQYKNELSFEIDYYADPRTEIVATITITPEGPKAKINIMGVVAAMFMESEEKYEELCEHVEGCFEAFNRKGTDRYFVESEIDGDKTFFLFTAAGKTCYYIRACVSHSNASNCVYEYAQSDPDRLIRYQSLSAAAHLKHLEV